MQRSYTQHSANTNKAISDALMMLFALTNVIQITFVLTGLVMNLCLCTLCSYRGGMDGRVASRDMIGGTKQIAPIQKRVG